MYQEPNTRRWFGLTRINPCSH